MKTISGMVEITTQRADIVAVEVSVQRVPSQAGASHRQTSGIWIGLPVYNHNVISVFIFLLFLWNLNDYIFNSAYPNLKHQDTPHIPYQSYCQLECPLTSFYSMQPKPGRRYWWEQFGWNFTHICPYHGGETNPLSYAVLSLRMNHFKPISWGHEEQFEKAIKGCRKARRRQGVSGWEG